VDISPLTSSRTSQWTRFQIFTTTRLIILSLLEAFPGIISNNQFTSNLSDDEVKSRNVLHYLTTNAEESSGLTNRTALRIGDEPADIFRRECLGFLPGNTSHSFSLWQWSQIRHIPSIAPRRSASLSKAALMLDLEKIIKRGASMQSV